jgi:type I restriction enzyme, S subunit
MSQGRDLRMTKETITDLAIRECNCRQSRPGTVMLSFKLSVGKVGIARVPLFTNEAIASLPIKAPGRLCTEFLYWALQAVDLTLGLDRAAKGLILNKAKLLEIQIPLPPLAEQRRIAQVLDRAEALRAKRRAVLAQLNSLVQSIFLDLFGDPVTFPERFPSAKLGAVTTFIDYRGISPNKQPRGVRLVTARNIKRGWFEAEPEEFIPAEEYASWMRRGIPRAGDVLFTTEGHTLGSAAQLPQFKKAALAQRLIALQPSDQLCSEYLLQVILDRRFQDEVLRRATGSAARGISSKQLAEIVIGLPPVKLQLEFARRMTAVEKLKTAQRASLAELDELFDSLKHRAFRGDL